jgi:signal peptidase I
MPPTPPSSVNELRRDGAAAPQPWADVREQRGTDREQAGILREQAANETVSPAEFYAVAIQNQPTIKPGWAGSTARSSSAANVSDAGRSEGETTTRHILESFLCLAIAVIVFRSFVLEGYIISTGSMAPTLLGYHKRVKCPDCGFQFAVGVAFDDGSSDHSHQVMCPNCEQPHIDATTVPKNSGDQLLVFKEAFSFRDPDRWEIAVFLNPNDPTQAYVKRTIGRPGEKVQIRDGDVFINDQRARKSYAKQRSIRIPVFDDAHYPRLDRAFARWLPEPGWTHDADGFRFEPLAPQSADSRPAALDSALAASDRGLAASDSSFNWVSYFHLDRTRTRGRSNLDQAADATIAAGGQGEFGETPTALDERQPGPITDAYGYNSPSRSREATPVHDLMLSCRVAFPEARGQFAAMLRNRDRFAVLRLDRASRDVAVWVSGHSAEHAVWQMQSGKRPLIAAPVSPDSFAGPIEVDVSTFDRQLIVGLNTVEILSTDLDQPLDDFSPTDLEQHSPEFTSDSQEIVLASAQATDLSGTTAEEADAAGRTVQFGARGGSVDITDLCLYRDVHYTGYDYRHGVREPVQLDDDEFFFLGDNSPVSLDSRGWKSPTVSRHLIVGRPLVVHLPSKPGELHFAGQARSIRVPDFSRMRYVR